MRSFSIQLSMLCLLGAAPLAAQLCPPLAGTGQPGYPVPPPCAFDVAPPVVWVFGNPLFEVGAFAPLPALAGCPMVLVLGLPPAPIPLPIPPLFPPYGPGSVFPPVAAIPAGFGGPVPTMIGLPIPVTGGPLGMVLTAQTAVLVGTSVALSEATGIII